MVFLRGKRNKHYTHIEKKTDSVIEVQDLGTCCQVVIHGQNKQTARKMIWNTVVTGLQISLSDELLATLTCGRGGALKAVEMRCGAKLSLKEFCENCCLEISGSLQSADQVLNILFP